MVKRGNFSFQTTERWSCLKRLLITNKHGVDDAILCQTLNHLIHEPTQDKKNDEFVNHLKELLLSNLL